MIRWHFNGARFDISFSLSDEKGFTLHFLTHSLSDDEEILILCRNDSRGKRKSLEGIMGDFLHRLKSASDWDHDEIMSDSYEGNASQKNCAMELLSNN